MPANISWKPNETRDEVVRHLAQGECVVLPTESTYELVASALSAKAVATLDKVIPKDGAPAVVFGGYAGVFDWLPWLGGAGARLIRKLGPGPVTLAADAGYRSGIWARLPDTVRSAVVTEQLLSMRWPAHPIWGELSLMDLPLVSASLPSAKTAEDARKAVGGAAALVVDGGPTQYGVAPSRVNVVGRRCQMVREGGLARALFDELVLCRILFICTGNTCRSPLARALCEKMLADRLGCKPNEIRQHGFLVQSAGLAAMIGAQASSEAVAVASEFGAALGDHQSAMVTLEMLQWADFVYTMTANHCYTLLSVPPAGFPEPRMLSPRHEDIADPIGGALLDYRTCAQQIRDCLEQRLPEILEN